MTCIPVKYLCNKFNVFFLFYLTSNIGLQFGSDLPISRILFVIYLVRKLRTFIPLLQAVIYHFTEFVNICYVYLLCQDWLNSGSQIKWSLLSYTDGWVWPKKKLCIFQNSINVPYRILQKWITWYLYIVYLWSWYTPAWLCYEIST